jgi:hypothetical protein
MRGKGLAGKRTFGNRSRRLESRYKPDSVFGKRQRGLPKISFGRARLRLPRLGSAGVWVVIGVIALGLSAAPGERTIEQSCAATRAQRKLVQRTLVGFVVKETELATQGPRYAGQPQWKTHSTTSRQGVFGLWGSSTQKNLTIYADGTDRP